MDARIRIRHLNCFVETARLASLSAAAEALGISQPAASKTIRELETILGVDLFDRSRRRLALTTAGKVFQQHVGNALTGLSRAEDLVRNAPREKSILRIGALPTAATRLMPEAALDFTKAFPDCSLRVSTGPNWMLLSQLRAGQLDMVVGRMAGATAMEGLSFRPLMSETIVAAVRPGHPLIGVDDPWSQFGHFPLMLPPPGAVIAPIVKAQLHAHGMTHPDAAFESVSLAFGRAIVGASDTIWIISRGVVEVELSLGTLTEIGFEDGLLGAPVGISMRQNDPVSREQLGLVEALVARGDDAGS